MSQTPALPTYSAIYAFGDSLSDAGNLSIFTSLTGTEPVSPPYYQEKYGAITGNVFSNGPTWVQDLSIALGLGTLTPSLTGGTDFAYGGAETGATPQNANDPKIQAISLPSQILQFEAAVPHPSANALYTLSIGGNDLFDILAATGLTASQQTTDVNDAVANAIGFIKQLVGDGAKNLLVLGVPDLGQVPEVTSGLINGSNTPSAALDAEASQLSAEFNTDLASQLASLATADGLNAHVVDAYQLIDNAVADPAAYGLTNVTAPVWSGSYTSSSSGTLAASGAAAQDQYLFWDHVHPTETGHQLIADAAEVALIGSPSTGQITQIYTNILQRAPDPAGLLYWDAQVDSGAVTVAQANQVIATSAEAGTDVVPIVELYTALGRAPDAARVAVLGPCVRSRPVAEHDRQQFPRSPRRAKRSMERPPAPARLQTSPSSTRFMKTCSAARRTRPGSRYLGGSARLGGVNPGAGADGDRRVRRGTGARCGAGDELPDRRRQRNGGLWRQPVPRQRHGRGRLRRHRGRNHDQRHHTGPTADHPGCPRGGGHDRRRHRPGCASMAPAMW